MSVIASIPIIKELIAWIRNHDLIEYLKQENFKKDNIIESKDKHISKLYRRVKKLEK